jgi:hypothetical protein
VVVGAGGHAEVAQAMRAGLQGAWAAAFPGTVMPEGAS